MPETGSCTPFALSLLIAPKGDKHQITFGIIKGCPEGKKPSWTITFLLEEWVTDKWKKRVDFKLDVNVEASAKTDKAEKVADMERLTPAQADWVTSPMYVAAVREGSTSPTDVELIDLIRQDARAFEEEQRAGGQDSDVGLEGEAGDKLSEILSARAAGRRRPTLKQLSIMFLDID
jgi:hypothetical protein